MSLADFTFNRSDGFTYNLRNNGGYMVYKSELVAPQLKVKEFNVDGADGILTSTDGNYEPRSYTLPCVFKTYAEAQKLINAFNGADGELDLNFIEGKLKVKRVNGVYTRDSKGIPEVDILLTIQPFSFLDRIERTITTSGTSFSNSGELEASCRMLVYGASTGVLTLNGSQFTISGLSTTVPVILDSEALQITKSGVNHGENVTGKIKDVKIVKGSNFITFGGTITKIEIEYVPKLFR